MAGVWTNNWKGIKNMMLLSEAKSGWSTIKGLTGSDISSSASGRQNVVSPAGIYVNGNSANYGGAGYPAQNAIVFGSGSGTPAASDYCLGAKWTSNISRVSLSQSESYDDATHTKTKTVTCTVQNTGSAAVTIREWGIEAYPGAVCLLYRALLDTPVTLQQYESATFTCTISLRLTDPI